MKTILRSIGAVLAGFLAVAVLSILTDLVLHNAGVIPDGPLFDTPLLLLALGYRLVFTVVGGYVTAALAPNHPMRHVLVLAILGTIAGSAGAVVARDLGPAWYAWGIVVGSPPCLWVGAALHGRGKKRA